MLATTRPFASVGTRRKNTAIPFAGGRCGCVLGRAVILAGEVEEFGFDGLPFRFGFAGDLSVDLVAKGTLVPTLRSIRVGRTIG